jgi:DDE family transposase
MLPPPMTPYDFYDRLRALFLHFVQTIPTRRPQDFSRCRKLPLARLIVVLLSLVASGRDKGVDTKLEEVFTLARRSDLWPEGQSPHRSALTKARAKIPWQAFDTFLNHTVALAYEVFPSREEYLWQGLSVFAFDGSKYTLPATAAMRQAFDPQSGLEYPGRGHYPQCLVMTAYDVFRRLPVGRTVCALQDGDERVQAQHLLPLLPPNSLSLFDRGFPSYSFLHSLQQHAHLSLMRCPATSTFPAVEAFARSGRAETRLWLTPSETFKRSLPLTQRWSLAPLRLRAIRLEEPDGTVSILVTNLLNRRRFPRPAIMALYWRRWTVETHYRDEKTLQHIEQFHSHTPDGIRQELFAILIGCVIARTFTALAVPSESIETAQSIVQPQRKNALMRFAREAALLTPAHPAKAIVILQELLTAIRRVKYYKPKSQRPARPRVNKQPVNKWQSDRKRKLEKAA